MKIRDLFKQKKVRFSCEIFPPKKSGQFEQAEDVVRSLAAVRPDFVSVTYGAGGSMQSNTVRLAAVVQHYGIPALAHLTCFSSTKRMVDDTLAELRKNGIENILALRGDPPRDGTIPEKREYRYASELIREIRSQGDFCIGGACYPEGHPESRNREEDLAHLKEKVDCGCDFLTTQMFFDNTVFYSFLSRARAKGIEVPILPGIMPITSAAQVARVCALSGAELPAPLRSMTDRFADDPAAMRQAGIAYATEQIADLLANGVRAIHIYTMNQPDVAAKIKANLSEIIK